MNGCLPPPPPLQVQRSDDIRLERPLLRACSRDMRRFCKDVEMGEGGEGRVNMQVLRLGGAAPSARCSVALRP